MIISIRMEGRRRRRVCWTGRKETRLKRALSRLPEEQRQCLHLRAEGLRYREIGEVLGRGDFDRGGLGAKRIEAVRAGTGMKHLTETELVMALDGELEPDESAASSGTFGRVR